MIKLYRQPYRNRKTKMNMTKEIMVSKNSYCLTALLNFVVCCRKNYEAYRYNYTT